MQVGKPIQNYQIPLSNKKIGMTAKEAIASKKRKVHRSSPHIFGQKSCKNEWGFLSWGQYKS